MPDLLPSLATVLAADANVSDELRGAGIAFGTLVERTGAAVAATQLQLDTSSAATASALACGNWRKARCRRRAASSQNIRFCPLARAKACSSARFTAVCTAVPRAASASLMITLRGNSSMNSSR